MKKILRSFAVCILTFNLQFLTLNCFAQFTKLLDFANAANGKYPMGSLISDGTFLYGMTYNGGTSGDGIVFRIKPGGTGDTTLLNFTGTNGSNPIGDLISDGTFLYGTTPYGGAYGNGVLFKIKPDGSGYADLFDFGYTATGGNPRGSLISTGGFLYGMTEQGGTNSAGVIFKIMPDGSGFVKLLDFAGATNGSNPAGSLISDGTFLYGMTQQGGTNGDGVIFKIKPDGSGDTVLLNFSGAANGRYPQGSLISDGTFLYGMAKGGGANTLGTVFKIKPDGTGYTDLFDFAGANGMNPTGSLISAGGVLYGMTSDGGADNNGTIFKINPNGTGFSKLHDFFVDPDANAPYGSLIYGGGFLYGMTYSGGINSYGTVFKFYTLTIDSIHSTPVSCHGGNNGTAAVFASGGLPPYTYLWSNLATTSQVTNLMGYNYGITVTDANSMTVTVNVNITQPNQLNVWAGSVVSPVCDNAGVAKAITQGGTKAYTYFWSSGQSGSDTTALGLAAGNYSITVIDANGCTAANTFTMTNTPLPAPSICAVTVDSLSQYNIILWDKTPYAGGKVDSFIIYREITTNNYQIVGAVPFDSLSMFVDTVRAKYFPYTGDPNNGTYRYKLAVRDTCGDYSAMGNYHNTIYTTNNSGTFSWNFYTIENNSNPVTGYLLKRDDLSNGTWHTVAGVSGTQQTVTDPNYSSYQSTASWRVQTQWSISCTATIVNPKNPYINSIALNSSRSNVYRINNPNSVNELSANDLMSISPNPSSGMFNVQCLTTNGNTSTIEIFNVMGEKVYSSVINSPLSTIHLDVPNGIYFLQLKTKQGTAVKKIIINK